jgi:hypothetical protein
LPELLDENILIYEVYFRVFNITENIDPFKVMDLLKIKNQLHCLDLIQSARNYVLRNKKNG